MSTTLTPIHWIDAGFIDYQKAWELQERLFGESISQKIRRRNEGDRVSLPQNHFIYCEHPPVYTLGKSGNPANLLINDEGLKQRGIGYYKTNRGGDITFHGPGQIVGYPILDLDQFFTDIHRYLRYLEEAVMLTLAHYGIESGRIPGLTGVWIDGENPLNARKICALGVKCSRWVTMHGFAFNVNTDLEYFNHIIPCGIDDKAVTSMKQELGRTLSVDEVKEVLKRHLCSLFGWEPLPASWQVKE